MERILVPDDWRYSRIREDIDNGRLWKARDRLQGHLATAPADQVVLDLLGSVWFVMGDLPQGVAALDRVVERDDGHEDCESQADGHGAYAATTQHAMVLHALVGHEDDSFSPRTPLREKGA